MLPRRAVIALATTAIALALLLNFKTPPGGTSGPASAPASRAAQSQSSAAPSIPSTHGTALKAGHYAGPVVQIPFGNVQVQVTISGGRIVDVQPIQMPTAHALSQQIAQYAAPILRQEALQAQSAQINLVSGATYTSEGYAQSLQGAIDQAQA